MAYAYKYKRTNPLIIARAVPRHTAPTTTYYLLATGAVTAVLDHYFDALARRAPARHVPLGCICKKKIDRTRSSDAHAQPASVLPAVNAAMQPCNATTTRLSVRA
eukprot:scaffold12716_cov136-Isochrysis_galbana.AAC.2